MGNCLGMLASMLAENRRKPNEGLLPGIIDHIVLDQIVTRLHWKDCYRLSSVSRAWRNAVRSRQVFDSRVLFNSSPDTVVGWYSAMTIALYSIRDNSWHTLPLIGSADVRQGNPGLVPAYGTCILMGGKFYVLGGSIDYWTSEKVFVFDLAGGGRWKQCASKKQRHIFGSTIKDEKIYVFGATDETLILNSEVYDPVENTWSNIMPTTIPRYGHSVTRHVTQIGQAFCLYDDWPHGTRATFLEAHEPFKNEWQVMHRSWNRPKGGEIFTVRRNVFSIQRDCTPENFRLELYVIDKYDVDGNSWIRVHSFPFVHFVALMPVEYRLWPQLPTILAVDDEIIALVACCPKAGTRRAGLCVFQSTGFGSKNLNISWKLRAITVKPGEYESAIRYFVQIL